MDNEEPEHIIDEGCPISMDLDHKKQCVVLNYSRVFLEDYDRYMEHLIKNIDWCIKKVFKWWTRTVLDVFRL